MERLPYFMAGSPWREAFLADLSKGSSAPQKVRRQRMAQQVFAVIWRIQTDSSQCPLHDVAHGIGRATEASLRCLALDEYTAR